MKYINELTPEDALLKYGSNAWSEYSKGRIKIKGLPNAKKFRQAFIGCSCPKCGITLTFESSKISPTPTDYPNWEAKSSSQGVYWAKWSNVEIAHKYPRAGYPELTFDTNNWDITCAMCNRRDGVIFSDEVVKKGKILSKCLLSKLR